MRRGTAEYTRATIAMLALGLTIFNSLYTTQVLLPVLVEDLQVSPTVAALTVSAATGALAIFVVPASILSERFGRGRILIISAVVSSAIALILPLAQDVYQLIALRGLQGIVLAGAPAVAMTWISEEVDSRDMPRAMGIYIAGNTIGGLTGRLIPAGMLEIASWRWALLASGVVALALAIATAVLLPAQKNFKPKKITPRSELNAMIGHLTNPRLLALYLTAFLGMGTFVSLYNYLGFRMVEFFGLAPSLAGLVFLLYLSGTWASARAGNLIERFGRGKVLSGGAAVMVVGLILVASSQLWLVLLGVLSLTAGFFAMHSTASGWVGQIATENRAEASSMYLFSYYAGSSIVGAATGAVFEALQWPQFVIFLACMIIPLVIIGLVLLRGDSVKSQG